MDTQNAVAFLRLTDPEVDDLLPALTHEERFDAWHLVTAPGRDLTGEAAILMLLRSLGPTSRFSRLLDRRGVRSLLIALNDLMKVHRSRLGRFVVDVNGPHRPPGKSRPKPGRSTP